jgi:hypothetical protein
MNNGGTEAFRIFAMRGAILACAAVVVFWTFYAADHYLHAAAVGGRDPGPLLRYFAFNAQAINNPASSLAGVNAAVFGIVITVCSIIVQLTADRYTGVAGMFLRDRTNTIVAAYYVIACVVSVWLSASLQPDYVPLVTLVMTLSLTTGGIVLMVPYFAYVFWFLEPQNLIARIRKEAVGVAGKGALQADAKQSAAAQAHIVEALEELTDITSNSISGKDKIIASAAVDALRDLAIEYLRAKPQAAAIWFEVGADIRLNPDFVSMDPESLRDLEVRRSWVEWKVLRQYLSIYNEALGPMRDINYLIAIDTRYIAEAAARAGDQEVVQLVFRFLNSFLRATLNARDVRTMYNVLNQYRKLGEFMLSEGHHEHALSCVKHMKYYGLVAFDMDLHFVTETVAHDLSTLTQVANQMRSPAEGEVLAEFLELDRPPFVRGHDKALLGVRKAQAKLAAYYLLIGEEARARAIANDMREEPLERLNLVRRQLETVANKDFWEITDRGRNFEYMPAEQRACLATFFSWLNVGAV